jgi:hypothetical protein
VKSLVTHVTAPKTPVSYSGRKITASLGNVTVRGEIRWERQGGSTTAKSMYSITENVYYSQLSSSALLLQPERNCFTSYNIRKGLGSLSLCAFILQFSPPFHVSICNGQQSSQLLCVHYTVALQLYSVTICLGQSAASLHEMSSLCTNHAGIVISTFSLSQCFLCTQKYEQQRFTSCYQCNSMEQSPSSEADSLLAGKKFHGPEG